MTRATQTVLSFAALLFCAPALAGGNTFIQLTVSSTPDGTPGNLAGFTARVVVDASAPPVSDDGSVITFAVVEAELGVATVDSPFADPGAYSTAGGTVIDATMSYAVGADTLSVSVAGLNVDATSNAFFQIEGPTGFAPGMTSLPDDPMSYAPNAYLIANLNSTLGFSSVSWLSSSGMNGGNLRMHASAFTPAPTFPGCNVADLAEPYGFHDFTDVLAYLNAFTDGCP